MRKGGERWRAVVTAATGRRGVPGGTGRPGGARRGRPEPIRPAARGTRAAARGTRPTARRIRAALAGLALLVAAAAPARAQIVNTLRGWAEPDSGWSGEVRGQVALADGNTEYFELALGGAAQALIGRHRVRALVSETLRRASGEKVAEDLLLHLRHNYRIRPWLVSLAFAQLQYNPFRRLERRLLLGLGARFDVVRGEAWSGALGVSGMLERERITDRSGTETQGRASYFLSVVGRVASNVRLDLSGFWQPRFTDLGDARAFLEAGARVDVVGGLGLQVALDLEHDSDPPEEVEETDLTLSSGLVFEF